MKIIALLDEYEGFGETILLASRLGWTTTYTSINKDDYDDESAEEFENDALDYLRSRDVTVVDFQHGVRN
jgi:hypothetical protein